MNFNEFKKMKDEITREEARKLVRLGLYRSVAEAWNEQQFCVKLVKSMMF